MEMYHFSAATKTARSQSGLWSSGRAWQWLKRGCALAFGFVLLTHVAVMAVYYPVITHDRNVAKLKIGDSEETMIQLIGQPGWTKTVSGYGKICEYNVYPWLLNDHRQLRRRWRVILDDSNRVVAKHKLDNYGC